MQADATKASMAPWIVDPQQQHGENNYDAYCDRTFSGWRALFDRLFAQQDSCRRYRECAGVLGGDLTGHFDY